MSLWHDVITPNPRQVVVHSPRPLADAVAIIEDLIAGVGAIRGRARSGYKLVDGMIDGLEVSFTAVPASRATAIEPAPVSRSLEFTGTLDAESEGSVLTGSISAAPTAFGLPAAAITALFGLFLWWNAIPLPLVAVGVVAWIFVTIIVIAGLGEQRLAGADAIGRLLEDALA